MIYLFTTPAFPIFQPKDKDRLFDTAYMYGSEKQIGQGILDKIAEGLVKREDIFYITKLWYTFHSVEHVERIFRLSLANSGLDYVDLYLIHFPVGLTYHGDDQLLPKNADEDEDEYAIE